MSGNNSGPKNSKIFSLFITFAILFIVVFSLGVIIGKGLGGPDTRTIERSYDEEVPEEKSSELEIAGEGLGEDSDQSELESDISEIESEEVVLDEETESQKQETTDIELSTAIPQSDKTTNKSEPDSKEVIKESQEVRLEKSPPKEKDSSAAKSAMPKIDPGGRYTVQIGAFQNQTEANKLVNSMKSEGYPAFIKQFETPDNKRWYRVRVGTFSTRARAVEYGDKLKERQSRIKSVFITANN